MVYKTEPVRELEIKYDDNGHPSWCSFPSHKNVQVRGACDVPPHLPGLVILVHGVNSTGEWYQKAESALCAGLNKRLGLEGTNFELKANIYSGDDKIELDEKGAEKRTPMSPLVERKLVTDNGRSPVIRFYWGYSSPLGDEDKFVIPLVSIKGDDYHQMKRDGVPLYDILKKGPYIWGGGPFQNGTNNLHSLWSKKGFNEDLANIPGAKVQYGNEDKDRLLTTAPPRNYYAHAAKRLADLLDLIREKYPKDTVTIISHSQGTMVSMAATALANKAPDALFIMNSPYALHNSQLNAFSMPPEECISPSGRESTLSAIIDKVALQSTHLSSLGYEGLRVGQSQDNKNWKPDITLVASDKNETRNIQERDNHGRTYVYFNPHDRVMGSLPLRSIGWQGFPNDEKGNPHPLITQHKGYLFQRMLARNTPCGIAPESKTPFGRLPDGKPFWDDEGDEYQSSGFVYPDPPHWQTVFINAEEVPEPIKENELSDFDKTRVGAEHGPQEKNGWGERDPKTGYKNDDTYDNFINLYPDQDIVIGVKKQSEYGTYGSVTPVTRKETFDEKDRRIRSYVAQPTDHSTLPSNLNFMARVVAYDLPIGYCESGWDRAFITDLRRRADWTQGLDTYLKTGIPNNVTEPEIISKETALEEMIRVKTKEYGY